VRGSTAVVLVSSIIVTAILTNVTVWTGDKLVYARKLLFSPGEVSATHSRLDCTDCHIPFKRIDAGQCKTCHSQELFKKSISGNIVDAHLAFLSIEGEKRRSHRTGDGRANIFERLSCIACHSEHKGKRAEAALPLKAVGHDSSLKALIACSECHQTDHDGRHTGMSNKKCDECHTINSWSTPFSHRNVKEIKRYLEAPDDASVELDGGLCVKCHKQGRHIGSGDISRAGKSGFECFTCHRF